MRVERGFMLIELVVALTIMLIALGGVLGTLTAFERTNRANQLQNEAQDRTRQPVEREFRNHASPSPDLQSGIERAEGYDVVAQTVGTSVPPFNARNSRRVRYCLDSTDPSDGKLWRMHQDWTGAVPAMPSTMACPGVGWTEPAMLSEHLVNRSGGQERPLFSYNSTDRALITDVQMRLWVDVEAEREPAETSLRGGVVLRNQNRPPVADFTATKTGRGTDGLYHVLVNGTLSEDPDGDALLYTWFDGATELTTTSASFDFATSAGAHVVKLTVRDTAGLGDDSNPVTVTLP